LDDIIVYKRPLREGRSFTMSKAIGRGTPGSFLTQFEGVAWGGKRCLGPGGKCVDMDLAACLISRVGIRK
jgi:hypothetical protein